MDGLDSYKKVRGVDPEIALNNVKKLLERNFMVVINTTMMPFHKKEEILKLYHHVLDLGVDQFSLDVPFLAGSAKKNKLNSNLKEYADTVKEISRHYVREKPKMNFDSVGIFSASQVDPEFEPKLFARDENPCSYQLTSIIVDAGGNIKVCPSMEYSVGNIQDFDRLEDFRKTKKWKDFVGISIADLGECAECRYREICGGGCRANVPGKDLLALDTMSCYLMERFEKDIMPILPKEVRERYRESIERCE